MGKPKLGSTTVIVSLLLVASFSMITNSVYGMAAANKDKMNISNNKVIERSLVSGGDTSRLERVFVKAKIKKEKIVVATIGGSITEGALATKPENRYASIVAQWFKDKFGDDNVEFINAGIGATGSGIGAHRVEKDVLIYKPDFVITEFGVNDSNTKECAESYEGMLRQILKYDSSPAVVMVFMMKDNGTNAQQWQSKLGYHYNLPMISYHDALWPQISAKKLDWNDVAADNVHPKDRGHRYCADFIISFLEKVYSQVTDKTCIGQIPPLPAPLFTDRFEYTKLLTTENSKPSKNNGWDVSEKDRLGIGWQSSTPGSILEFDVEGTEVRIVYYRIKGDMGTILAQVDDLEPIKIDSWFDQDWGGYDCEWPIGKNLDPKKSHTLKIKLLDEKNENSHGNLFKLRAVMVSGISKQYDSNDTVH